MKMPLSAFWRAQTGATAMIYAICLLPVLAGLGLTLDLSRVAAAQTRVQSALDAAVLASTRDMVNAELSDAQVTQRARDYFFADLQTANLSVVCAVPGVVLDRKEFDIEMTGNCDMPTTLMAIVGTDKLYIHETATAMANVTTLDLGMMLDISGSMSGAKLDALKASAKTAISTLITPETGTRVRIGLAPYSTAVNVDPFGTEVFGAAGAGQTCASERTGAKSAMDVAPGMGQWIETAAIVCPASAILPITHEVATLNTAIDALVADGATAGHLGIAWAWYLIAPEWKTVWPGESAPLAYDDARAIKALILMSDGEFNTQYDSALGTSDEQARAMCDEIRKENILVFSVAFQAPPTGEDVLRYCASEPGAFFNADSTEQLGEAYKSIASTLSELRLTD
jgi:Flp pilus assembly protein TadG